MEDHSDTMPGRWLAPEVGFKVHILVWMGSFSVAVKKKKKKQPITKAT